MPRIRIDDLRISERAESKFWTHGISRDQVYEMLQNERVVIENRTNRAAKHIMIGRDNNNRCIAVPVLPTDDPGVWRPITAWYCKSGEAAKLR